MTYKVPYTTVKMIFIIASHIMAKISVNTQKMLVSPSDFMVKLERMGTSSQRTE